MNYSELGDAIQVDVSGSGLLAYAGQLTPDLELEFHTLINNSLKEYGELTSHDPSTIGYNVELTQSKRYSRKHNSYETAINLSIVFQKPVPQATCFQLEPTIQLITSTIIEEIFILGGSW